MKKEIKEYIKRIKMTEENIKLKNAASIITIIVESIKVLLALFFMNSLSTLVLRIIFIYAIIAIPLAIFILFTDDYKKLSKYIFLDLSTFIFFFSNIIGGILTEKIIWIADKKLLKEMNKAEDKIKPLPNKLNYNKKVYAYLFLSIIIAYNYIHMNEFIFYILVFITLISFFVTELKMSIKDFKKNEKVYISFILKNFIIFSLISSILFIIVGIIVKSNSTNELILNEHKISTIILGIFYAPIAEELLFRGCLRKLIKNDILFIIISGIGFGAWHVVGYDQSILQYLYIIPYSMIGIGLSYVYAKTNNLTINIGMHALNNILASL